MVKTTTSSPPDYLWQHPAWPALTFDVAALMQDLSNACLEQGKLLSLLEAIGRENGQKIARELGVQVAMATAAIEGERLDLDAVRSSVAHRLGLAGLPTVGRHVDGLVQVMADATQHYPTPLTKERLCLWRAALSPGEALLLRPMKFEIADPHPSPLPRGEGVIRGSKNSNTIGPNQQLAAHRGGGLPRPRRCHANGERPLGA